MRSYRLAFLAAACVACLACSENNYFGDPPDRDAASGGERNPGDRADVADDATAGVDGSEGSGEPDAVADAAPDTTPDAADDITTLPDVTEDAPAPDTGVDVVDTTPTPDAEEDGEACVEIAYVADEASRPADIIWVIDSSESMDDEITQVQANINEFASLIESSGVDVRVVMIASKYDDRVEVELPIPIPLPIPVYQEYLGVCVPPPLSAAPGCPDTDNRPTFLHPHVNVYSTDALTRLFESYDDFSDVLRPWAKTHLVVVTDDSSEVSAASFQTQAAGLPGPGFTDLAFHSIVDENGTLCGDGPGDDYIALSNATGGVVQSVCLADWQPIFDALFAEVLAGAQIPCAFAIPDPPDDAEIVPDEVNVYLTPDGGEESLVLYVENEASCTPDGGWYYDDPEDPRVVYLCPSVCGEGREGAVDIAFGCRTVKV